MAAAKAPPPRLGRGLAALLGDTTVPAQGEVQSALRPVPLDLLEPNPYQPRQGFDPAAMEELAESIRARGVLQPLLVRPDPKQAGRFQIVAGERRWRAAGLAGLHEIPAVVREMSDIDAASAALIENLQRQDLNPMEEAEGYSKLVDDLGVPQETLAQALGRSRSHISNMLRLLNLPDQIQTEVRKGSLTFGHARALLAHADPESAMATVLAKGLTVRETEALAAERKSRAGRPPRPAPTADVAALEKRITEHLGCPAKIVVDAKGAGSLSLEFGSLQELEGWLEKLLPG